MSIEGIPPRYAIPPGPRGIRPTASLIEVGVELLADWKAFRRDATAACRMMHHASNVEAMGFDTEWLRHADPWPTENDPQLGCDFLACTRDMVLYPPRKTPAVATLDAKGNPIVNSAGEPLGVIMHAVRNFIVIASPDEILRLRKLITRSSRWLWQTREVSGRWIAYFQPNDALWWSGVFELLFANECAEASATRSIPLPPTDSWTGIGLVQWDANFIREMLGGKLKFGPRFGDIPPAWAERLPEAYVSRVDDPASASVGLVETIMDGLRRKSEQEDERPGVPSNETRSAVSGPKLSEEALADVARSLTPAMRRTLEWLYRWQHEPYPHDDGKGSHHAMEMVTAFALKATAAAEDWDDPSRDGSATALVGLGLVEQGETRLQDCRRWLAPNGVRMATFFDETTPDHGPGQYQRRVEADGRRIAGGWEVKLGDRPKPHYCYRLTGDGLRVAMRVRGEPAYGARRELAIEATPDGGKSVLVQPAKQAVAIPPAEQLALLEHADRCDAWIVASMDDKPQPTPKTTVRDLYRTVKVLSPIKRSGIFPRWLPPEQMDEVLDDLAALAELAPHIRHESRLIKTPGKEIEYLQRGIDSWCSDVLGSETRRLRMAENQTVPAELTEAIAAERADLERRVRCTSTEITAADFSFQRKKQPDMSDPATGAKTPRDSLHNTLNRTDSSPPDFPSELGKSPAKQGIRRSGNAGTIAERLERLRTAGEEFTSRRKMAERLGCSTTGVGKALETTEALTRWGQSNRRPPKRIDAVPLNAVVLDRLRAAPDEPIDDYTDEQVAATLAQLLNHAEPVERGRINAMDNDGQRRLAVLRLQSQDDDEPSPLDGAGTPAKVYKRA